MNSNGSTQGIVTPTDSTPLLAVPIYRPPVSDPDEAFGNRYAQQIYCLGLFLQMWIYVVVVGLVNPGLAWMIWVLCSTIPMGLLSWYALDLNAKLNLNNTEKILNFYSVCLTLLPGLIGAGIPIFVYEGFTSESFALFFPLEAVMCVVFAGIKLDETIIESIVEKWKNPV